MKKEMIIILFSLIIIGCIYFIYELLSNKEPTSSTYGPEGRKMTSTIITDIDTFVVQQNKNRGQPLAGGGTLALDYDALTGTVPAGGNAVTGISGIGGGAIAITLPASQAGNAVIFDGGVSTTVSTGGADSYSFLVNVNGSVTATDNNTGNSETITGASYLVFDGGAVTSSGAYQQSYLIETGVNAEMAAMYNAAFSRVPDFAGLEFYIQQYGTSALPDLHQMATFFNLSNEFKTLWPTLQTAPDNGGPNDIAYIDALYGKILGRTPNASEQQFYVNALQGKLTDSSGNPIAASDRADLLIYFSVSPENLAKITASSGGWLINSANGAQNYGALGQAAAASLLASEVSSGTINASDFANMSSTTYASQENVLIAGADSHPNGLNLGVNQINVGLPNITIDLNATYNFVWASGAGDVVNGYSGGGSIINLSGTSPGVSAAAANLFGNGNAINMASSLSAPIVTPTAIHDWNTTDIISTTLTNTGNWGPNDVVYTGNAANPINGASIQPGTSIAVNLGSITGATPTTAATAIAAAAAADYAVGGSKIQSVYFFAQVGADTVIYHWGGDSTASGHVKASDFDGAVDLVGVQASSLTGSNFH